GGRSMPESSGPQRSVICRRDSSCVGMPSASPIARPYSAPLARSLSGEEGVADGQDMEDNPLVRGLPGCLYVVGLQSRTLQAAREGAAGEYLSTAAPARSRD